MAETIHAAAFGGEGWSPRRQTLRQELGHLWAACGVESEWAPLRQVLLHRPGLELAAVTDPNRAQMLGRLDLARAQAQHDALVRAYENAGVLVHAVAPGRPPPPNMMFCADLFFMSGEGAIVGRPASTVRAGEERFIARRLAALGIPILRTVRGQGVFEGADAMWLDTRTVLLATGLRTNAAGASQVAAALAEQDVSAIPVELPAGAMHLMGLLRVADRDLAFAWPGRLPAAAAMALRERGFRLRFIPDEIEARQGHALNFVTLSPRRILMAAGNPITQAFYEAAGLEVTAVEIGELLKAAGGAACLTGVLQRLAGAISSAAAPGQ